MAKFIHFAVYLFCAHFIFLHGSATYPDDRNLDCRPWHYFDNVTKTCKCGSMLDGTIQCDDKHLQAKGCYCITADTSLEAAVGFCLYKCHKFITMVGNNAIYFTIRTNTTLGLNEETCGLYNRTGLMCGQCINSSGLPVYSYDLSCVECTDYKYNWLKYIAVAYVPHTLFYFVIITFRISATSGLMVGYVTVSQMTATYSLLKFYLSLGKNDRGIRIFSIFYSIWNLDLVRSVIPPFCLHPDLSALQVLSLDYIVAVYPMILVLLTYLLVKLHDHFRLVVWLCRPFYICLHYFRREWEIKSSLIGAFSTLLLLSYVKIIDISSNILMPTHLYHMNGTHGPPRVYNDINIFYLSKEHLPYFVTAIVMSFTFNVVPLLLLCLYPCRCFRKCLDFTGLHNQTLRIFMDSFHGHYKYKPRDFRYFPAIYLITQIVNLTLYYILGFFQYHAAVSYLLIAVIISLVLARPYKKKWHNVINIMVLVSVFIGYHAFIILMEQKYISVISHAYRNFWISCNSSVLSVTLFFPFCYGLALGIQQITPLRIKTSIKKILLTCFYKKDEELEESLPYRLQCANECRPLLSKK